MSTSTNRVKTVSDHSSFHPRSLATHPTLNYLALSGPLGIHVSKLVPNKPSSSGGIRLEQVLTIRHVNSAASNPKNQCCLKFSPQSDLKLASAIGSGVTLWDVGSSVSVPLLARLSLPPIGSSAASHNNVPLVGTNQNFMMGNSNHRRFPSDVMSTGDNYSLGSLSVSVPNTSVNADQKGNSTPSRFYYGKPDDASASNGISSLSWMKSGTELLVARENEIFMYDVRSMKSSSKPSMHFLSDDNDCKKNVPFSCVECNDQGLIGTIDRNGVVRLYDSRRASGRSSVSSCFSSFQAHDGFGAGISSYNFEISKNLTKSSPNESSGWITWGYDAISAKGCVKTWVGRDSLNNEEGAIDSNLYWYEGSLTDSNVVGEVELRSEHRGISDFLKRKEFGESSICCVRTCPFSSLVLTVDLLTMKDKNYQNQFNTTVWELDNEENKQLGSFVVDMTSELSKIVGHKIDNVGPLIASEIVTCPLLEIRDEGFSENNLFLCCLSSSGYLTTYSILEKTTKAVDNTAPTSHRSSSMSPPRLCRMMRKGSISSVESFGRDRRGVHSENHFWHLNSPGGQEEIANPVDVNLYDVMNPMTQFDIDVHGESKLLISPPPTTNKSSLVKSKVVLGENETEQVNVTTLRADPEHVPCPRLCGASFGYGNGKLVSFSNGKIQKMWSWLKHENVGSKAKTKVDLDSVSPRTLSDLLLLINASNKAQWGEDDDDESDSSNEFSESNSSSDDDIDGESQDENDDMMDLIDRKHSPISLPISRRSTNVLSNLVLNRSLEKSCKDLAAVLTTETLTPFVEYKSLNGDLFSNQSYKLAERWQLGTWFSIDNENDIENIKQETQKDNSRSSLYPNQSLTPDDVKDYSERTIHKPSVELSLSSRSLPDPSLLFVERKPELPRPSSVGSNLSFADFGYGANESSIERIRRGSLDFPVRTIPRPSDLSDSDMKQVFRMEKLCSHNATVCYEMNQLSKGDVWSVLNQSVRHAFSQDTDEFNGWRRVGGGALGQELVSDLLRHYEVEGDIQMCASIVCCLKPRRVSKSTSSYFLANSILPDNDEKYNTYLHNYANLLYYWGQVTVRAEVLKHASIGECTSTLTALSSQITISPLCPRCKKPTSKDVNLCLNCKDFAFRCSICNNAVQGLFTFCMSCGHGGHAEHILPWFSEYNECPTGCGCFCSLETFSRRDERPYNPTSI